MRIAIFCHSLVSDRDHGNAHFLRGVARELLLRGHSVSVLEPESAWSRRNLVEEIQTTRPGALERGATGIGGTALAEFESAFPGLHSEQYAAGSLDVRGVLEEHGLLLLHEWSNAELGPGDDPLPPHVRPPRRRAAADRFRSDPRARARARRRGGDAEVTEHLAALTPRRANELGDAARYRALADHIHPERARLVDRELRCLDTRKTS